MGAPKPECPQRPQRPQCPRPACSPQLYLQRILCAYGNDVVLVVAQLTAPAAPLTDPLDEARLVRALDRAITAARAQQLPLQGERERMVKPRVWGAVRWLRGADHTA